MNLDWVSLLISALVVSVIVVLAYFISNAYSIKVEALIEETEPSLHKITLFLFPFILTFLTCTIFSLFRVSQPNTEIALAIKDFMGSDLTFLGWVLGCCLFSRVAAKMFNKPAYDNCEKDATVLLFNYTLSCFLYVIVSWLIKDPVGALKWGVFLMGRFVWLDSFQDKGNNDFKKIVEGAKIQKLRPTVCYSVLALGWLFVVFWGLQHIQITLATAQGIYFGILGGCIVSTSFVLIEDRRRRKIRMACIKAVAKSSDQDEAQSPDTQ